MGHRNFPVITLKNLSFWNIHIGMKRADYNFFLMVRFQPFSKAWIQTVVVCKGNYFNLIMISSSIKLSSQADFTNASSIDTIS